ncbi:MAG: MFS transporter [Phycisphaerales bacterium]|nr:MFS transporter [Phycisphaerales bacterium]
MLGPLANLVSSFHPRALPPMLRRNFARELTAVGVLPFMLGAIQAGTMAVVLKKTFSGVPGLDENMLDIAVATMSASTAIGNLSSGIWAAVANGRRKVRLLASLMIATSIFVALMAMVPRTAPGAWMLVGLVIAGWITWSGVVTIRTAVWRANYPDADRAKIAGKLATMQVVMMAISGFIIGESLDISPIAFRVIFPILSVFGVLGACIYMRVRLRGQNRLARSERSGKIEEQPSLNPIRMLRVLRDDPAYAKYMICQFVFGVGNLMITPTLAIILEDEFKTSYLSAILVTSIIPLIVMPVAIPLWARFLDRVHVISFRAIHSWAFVTASGLLLLGVETHSFIMLLIASAVLGTGYAGGMLAWNLGHQHFAPPHRDTQYMSVHVMLTGLRGVIAPYLGVFIYTSFAASGHGGLIYAVSMVLNTAGAIGFVLMSRSLKRGQPVD